MKIKLIIIVAVIVALVLPVSIFAAASDAPAAKQIRGFFGIDISKLSDKQKADIKSYSQSMAELQKKFINKMVENGTMTKEQGNAAVKRIDESLANGLENGVYPGLGGMMKGGFKGRGMHEGSVLGSIDASKLTNAQKADLLASLKSMADLQKNLLAQMTKNELLTKTQQEAAVKHIDSILDDIQKNGFSENHGLLSGLKAFHFIPMGGISSAELTDAQKTMFKDFSAKMLALQKEMINKMTSNKALTKEQGEAALKKLDEMNKKLDEKGLPEIPGMKQKPFGGFRKMRR